MLNNGLDAQSEPRYHVGSIADECRGVVAVAEVLGYLLVDLELMQGVELGAGVEVGGRVEVVVALELGMPNSSRGSDWSSGGKDMSALVDTVFESSDKLVLAKEYRSKMKFIEQHVIASHAFDITRGTYSDRSVPKSIGTMNRDQAQTMHHQFKTHTPRPACSSSCLLRPATVSRTSGALTDITKHDRCEACNICANSALQNAAAIGFVSRAPDEPRRDRDAWISGFLMSANTSERWLYQNDLIGICSTYSTSAALRQRLEPHFSTLLHAVDRISTLSLRSSQLILPEHQDFHVLQLHGKFHSPHCFELLMSTAIASRRVVSGIIDRRDTPWRRPQPHPLLIPLRDALRASGVIERMGGGEEDGDAWRGWHIGDRHRRWVEKRKAKKDAKRNASVPPYEPKSAYGTEDGMVAVASGMGLEGFGITEPRTPACDQYLMSSAREFEAPGCRSCEEHCEELEGLAVAMVMCAPNEHLMLISWSEVMWD
ncbi:uncharacterized protein MYCFIDRAFT_179536 [Pseudocercospora fijiensis CIRAD86]|uniref:Uncharacterized protein n=1 Tax=Pseudocercospora fijiensis (strain CIRAD86) TaxID=383855 RepID=M3AKV4_PSEFD|nr:uncharacterized protein MYCFIDRAFT_179536 [Pseudocercospora fijiensis CIRAD86]EME78097.1 hypothetical protein MYCFIDRAFT_179536 [Pseudocercospora fijiensis CIRAD86]